MLPLAFIRLLDSLFIEVVVDLLKEFQSHNAVISTPVCLESVRSSISGAVEEIVDSLGIKDLIHASCGQ